MSKTAFIFAAGLGTRLKPLTDTMPKALVPYKGEAMLKTLILKLKAAGFERIIINVHHFADMIEKFVYDNNSFGLEILFSDERDLLRDTGGGIKHLAKFFKENDKPFLVHNCDIISNMDLKTFYEQHLDDDSLASLVVNKRESSRYLLFDEGMRLNAWININTGEIKSPYPELYTKPISELQESLNQMAFNGIHIISPRIFKHMAQWPEKFSIIDFYLSICKKEPIRSWRAPSEIYFKDIGKIAELNL